MSIVVVGGSDDMTITITFENGSANVDNKLSNEMDWIRLGQLNRHISQFPLVGMVKSKLVVLGCKLEERLTKLTSTTTTTAGTTTTTTSGTTATAGTTTTTTSGTTATAGTTTTTTSGATTTTGTTMTTTSGTTTTTASGTTMTTTSRTTTMTASGTTLTTIASTTSTTTSRNTKIRIVGSAPKWQPEPKPHTEALRQHDIDVEKQKQSEQNLIAIGREAHQKAEEQVLKQEKLQKLKRMETTVETKDPAYKDF